MNENPSKKMDEGRSNEKIRSLAEPFFIIGPVRSGTTLVEQLLNRHSKLFVPPETFFFTFLDRLGILGKTNPTDNDLRRFVGEYRKDRAFSFLDIPENEAFQVLMHDAHSYEDIFLNLMEYLRRQSEKVRWGEKTPNNLRYVAHIRKWFPRARFILVVRDGRASVLSQVKHPRWRRNLLACARHWAIDASVMSELIARLDSNVLHVVRFEHLLQNPARVVQQMCDFLGESFEENMIARPKEEQSSLRPYYQQSWMSKSTGKIDPNRAKQWLQEYSPTRLRLVEEVIGPHLESLDYPLVSPRAPAWKILYAWNASADVIRRLSNRFTKRSRLPVYSKAKSKSKRRYENLEY
jgi:hypothetical protein